MAHVQSDAVAELPPGIEAVSHRPADGVLRAVQGLVPVGSADVVHGLDVDLPLRTTTPTVTTVHDLSVFDAAWAHSRIRAAGERRLITRAVKRADAVVAVSAFTADRVAERFGRTAFVTHLAPRPGVEPPTAAEVESVRRRYRLPDRFVLHVGTVEPRKSVDTLARACHRLDVPLVLAGAGAGPTTLEGDVRSLGYVDEDELASFYGAASVLAYPSRYEGFGLPPVEALACGAVVLATRVGALPELFGGTLPLVEPNDESGLTDTLADLLAGGPSVERAMEQARGVARSLSWTETARLTCDAYRSAGVDL